MNQRRTVHDVELLASELSICVNGILLDRKQVQDLVGELVEWLAELQMPIVQSELKPSLVDVSEIERTSTKTWKRRYVH